MLHDLRSNDVHLLLRYPMVFSMESHQLTCVIAITLILFSWSPCSQFSARSRPHSSELQGSTLLRRLFHRNRSPSSAHDTSHSSPLDWTQKLLKRRKHGGEATGLQGCSPAVAEVPYAKGKRVSPFSLMVLFYLILRRETLAPGRNAKSYYCPRRVPLWAAHSLPSPMSLGHLRNPRQLTLHCSPHLLLVMLLQFQLQQHRHAAMQR
jgi:hypothetical protein